MGDTVPNEFDIRMSRKHYPKHIAQSMILIIKDIGSAPSIIFLLKYIMLLLSGQ